MTHRRLSVVCVAIAVVLLASSSPRAQQTASDGVNLFLRGDYAAAAAILQPLAEGPTERDHSAEFFMAVLYDAGLGVAADPIRACALYIRASTAAPTPLGAAAATVIRQRQAALGAARFDECTWHASVGFDHGFDPVTISLEPQHWIAWDLRGATITYRGVETRRELSLASLGARFLPLRHTELETGALRNERRHFFEIFKWAPPYLEPRTWSLTWMLFEVTRDELITVATERIATAAGDAPPSGDEVEARARVSVDADGRAVWNVAGATPPRNGVIESIADRQERARIAADERARAAAAARADYTRVYDVRRPPTLVYGSGNVEGCADLFVYAWSDDRAEVLTIGADRSLLAGAESASFDLTAPRAGLEVLVHVYERAAASHPFCTDVFVLPRPVEEVWRAVSGVVSVRVFPDPIPGRSAFMRRAAIQLSGAQFLGPSGARAVQPGPIVLRAIVGGYAG